MTKIHYSSVHEYATGVKKDPKLSLIAKIVDAFPFVNANWLLTGNGEPFRESENLSEEKGQKSVVADLSGENLYLKKNEKVEEELRKLEEKYQGIEKQKILLEDRIKDLTQLLEEKEKNIQIREKLFDMEIAELKRKIEG